MGFFQSALIKKLEQGELPTVKTDNTVTVDQNSLVKIGVLLIVVSVGIALLVIAVRSTK